MGIFCKIHVLEPPNKEFTPGSVVCGHIKYVLDKDTVVKSVNVSFRGYGRLEIEKREGKHTSTYTNAEEYIRIQNNIVSETTEKALSIGEYDTSFKFQLPEDIPPSLNYTRIGGFTSIICKIIYCIKIKFIVPGAFKFNKKFMKEIKVVSNIKPKLLEDPVIYGEQKKLFQPLRFNKSVVSLRAHVKNSALEPGDKVELVYNITNDTNKTINAVEVKALEVYTFYVRKYGKIDPVEKSKSIFGTDFKTSSIKSGDSVEKHFEITLPLDLHGLDHSQIVTRGYAVLITVYLPVPHANVCLKVPFQIGKISLPIFIPNLDNPGDEATDRLPTYWEAMNECNDKESKANEFYSVK